jgi:aspartyl-tRNA(Asn)/glutamyl-tRNA(Gln) amidotransferase subunit A
VPLYPGTKDETAPGVSGWESIEHIGPLTRTVADGALMMSVIASGPDDRDRRTVPNDVNWMEAIKGDIKGLRIAWTPDWGYAQVASPWKDDYFGHFFTIVLTETDLKGMRALVAQYGDRMQPHLVDPIKGTMTDEQITDAVIARKKCANQSWRFFRTYDLLLTPTVACVPFGPGIQGPELIEGKKATPFQWITFTF